MSLTRILVFSIIVLLLMLTLFGSPFSHIPRSFQHLWNIGHIILFGLLTFASFKYWEWFSKKETKTQIVLLVIFTGILSLLIEMTQYLTSNGSPDIIDIRRNIEGVLLSFLIVKSKNLKVLIWPRNIIILIVLFEIIPTVTSLYDEIDASISFPLLAGFETERELLRWTKRSGVSLDNKYKKRGNYSVKVSLKKQTYSGMYLEYFPGNWTGYASLLFDIFYPEQDSLKITCRIHDEQHYSNKKYEDRYNKSFIIIPGWNEIVINLTEVKEAPQNRNLNLSEIAGLGIFAYKLKNEKEIFLDNVRLRNKIYK